MLLLIGMVFAGVVIVVTSGWVLLDDLEGGVQTEQADSALDVTNDQLTDVAASGRSKELPTGTLDEGKMTIERNTTEIELAPVHGECGAAYSIGLNAFVYENDDRKWVLEGGGKWEIGPKGNAQVSTAPELDYGNERLSIDLLTLDANRVDRGDQLIARHSGDPVVNRSKLLDVLRCPGGSERNNSVRMNLTSEYSDAWDQHLSRAVTGPNVTYYGPDNASTADGEIRIVIDDLVEERQASFAVSDVAPEGSPLVTFDDGLQVSPRVHNTGTATGSSDVTLSINPEWNRSTGDIDPGSYADVSFDLGEDDLSEIGGVDADRSEEDLWQYGRYEYNVTAGSARGTSSFYLTYDQPFYRLENAAHSKNQRTVTVAGDFTNIGNGSTEHDLTFSLEGESEDGSIDIDRQQTIAVETAPWNRSTFTIDVNRSRLPYGTYNYTVDVSGNYGGSICADNPSACTRTGTFTLSEEDDGAGISNVSEVRVDEPSNVSVSVLGTEISAEWEDDDVRYRLLAPVTATAVVGDRRVRFSPEGTHVVHDPHQGDVEAHNLNTVGTQETVWDYDTRIDEGSVRIEATYWDCNDYTYVNTDTYDGETYRNYECTDFNESDYTQITVAGADSESGDGFVMTRDSSRNELPPIEKGYPRQRNVSEVFEDGTDDIELQDGELTLGSTDFAFMMETTTTHSTIQEEFDAYADEWSEIDTSNDTAMNLAAWDIAQHERDDEQGDPNFNDVIGLVQVDPGEEYTSLDDPLSDSTIDGERREPTDSEVNGDGARSGDDTDSIHVQVDEIVVS